MVIEDEVEIGSIGLWDRGHQLSPEIGALLADAIALYALALVLRRNVIGGALLKPEQGGKQLPLGDGVDRNDKPFRLAFPYVATPRDGFSGVVKRTEPAHAPVPQPPTP